LSCFNHCFYALTDEKQQIYKLAARHRVPRCEPVDLLFLKEIVKMSAKMVQVQVQTQNAVPLLMGEP